MTVRIFWVYQVLKIYPIYYIAILFFFLVIIAGNIIDLQRIHLFLHIY